MLLTIPQASKGFNLTISLSKNELFNLFSDDYFSIQSNVKRAIVVYASSSGNQKKVITFNLADEVPQAEIEISTHAKDSFLLNRIILEDFDNGTLTIHHNELSTSVISDIGTISFLT